MAPALVRRLVTAVLALCTFAPAPAISASLEQVRRPMRIQSSLRALAATGVLACALGACAPAANREAVVAQPTAQGTVSLPDGGELHLEQTRGHVVVLVFFTTWCPSSRPTLRALEELRARHAASGLEVIAVGEGETAAEVSTFAMQFGVRATVAFDKGGVLASQLGLPTVPAVIVIAPDGTIRHVHAGYHGDEDRSAIDREVTAMLEAAVPANPAEPPTQLSPQ